MDIRIRKSFQYKQIKGISNNWIYPDLSGRISGFENLPNTNKLNRYLIIVYIRIYLDGYPDLKIRPLQTNQMDI